MRHPIKTGINLCSEKNKQYPQVAEYQNKGIFDRNMKKKKWDIQILGNKIA